MRNLKIKVHGNQLLLEAIMAELLKLGYRDSDERDGGENVADRGIWFLYAQSDGVIWAGRESEGIDFQEDHAKEVLISDLLDYVRHAREYQESKARDRIEQHVLVSRADFDIHYEIDGDNWSWTK